MNWYYVSAGKQVGPVDDPQLQELARTGHIQMDTLVWREGMPEWQPYSTIASPASAAAPPPAYVVPAAPLPGSNDVVCAECHRIYPRDETIPFGNVRVCAGCKPIFMQKLAEGAAIRGELRYATVLTRFGAVFLDGLILQAFNIGLRLVLGFSLVQRFDAQTGESLGGVIMLTALGMLVAASYEILMVGKYGATLGKMACKVRVVTAEGGKVTYGRAAGRYFAKFLSSLLCLIGFIIAFFDEERRTLHDRICDTRVVTIA